MIDPSKFLNGLFESAVGAADPLKMLPAHLPPPPTKGRAIVVGAGKASAAMAKAVEDHWPDQEMSGLVVTRYGYSVPTNKIKIVEAAHPVSDDASEAACAQMFDLLQDLTPDDLVLFLISGGGSALLSMPAPCMNSREKRSVNQALLRSGAAIGEMNCVRKHLSAVKGGRLGLAAYPARVETFVISDVPGDIAHIVASGPSLPDPSTQNEALKIIDRYGIAVSNMVRQWMEDASNETPKPDDKRFANNNTHVVARAQDALTAAAEFARKQGITPIILGDDIEGEARDIGAAHIAMAKEHLDKAPCVLLSGGETTVTVRGNGRGGRNAEYLLSAVMAAQGHSRLYGLACDTDGIDGSENNAGAIFTPGTWAKAKGLALNPSVFLEDNDAYSFFEKLGDLVITGPTFTNVNDFRAILIL